MATDKDGIPSSMENSAAQTSNEEQHNIDRDGSLVDAPSLSTLSNDGAKPDTDHEELSATATTEVEVVPPTSNGDLVNDTLSDVHDEIPSSPLRAKGLEVDGEDLPVNSGQNVMLGDKLNTTNVDLEGTQSLTDAPTNVEAHLKDVDLKVEPHHDQKKVLDQKAFDSPKKVQDQLDEVNHL